MVCALGIRGIRFDDGTFGVNDYEVCMNVIRTRNRAKERAGRFHIGIIVFFLALVMTIQLANLYQKSRRYQEQEAALTAELERQLDRQQELADYEVYTQSDEFIENTAKSKLGLIHQNEIIFREQ